ncbi:MAG: type II secretion system F family protein [Pseudomonadota bacterium]
MVTYILQPHILLAIITTMGVFATILTLIMPMLAKDNLGNRMKSVALEREQLRARERQRLASESKEGRKKATKREPGALVKTIVDKLNLRTALADEKTEAMLIQAGYRGQSPLFIFLALRFGLPFLFMGVGALYLFAISDLEWSSNRKLIASAIIGYLGFYLPIVFLNNRLKARQLSITMAWPDALDLCLICVESGMSIEAAFRKVAAEIGPQSIPLAEELMLTTAELSYLQDRRIAYENLTTRTGLESVKNVVLSLIQAEKYGTPLSAALRVLSQENRDQRMSKAEQKAAALPPKLTVPMMVCFLPVLFCVILAPAVINSMEIFASQ